MASGQQDAPPVVARTFDVRDSTSREESHITGNPDS
jgi:hypothetical protein